MLQDNKGAWKQLQTTFLIILSLYHYVLLTRREDVTWRGVNVTSYYICRLFFKWRNIYIQLFLSHLSFSSLYAMYDKILSIHSWLAFSLILLSEVIFGINVCFLWKTLLNQSQIFYYFVFMMSLIGSSVVLFQNYAEWGHI